MSTLNYDILGKDVSGSATADKFGLSIDKVIGKLDKLHNKRVVVDMDVNDKGAITKINSVGAAADETNKKSEAASGGGIKRMGSALGVLAAVVGVAGGASVGAAAKFEVTGAKLAATADLTKTQATKINNSFLTIGSTSTFTGAAVAAAFTPVSARVKELSGGTLTAADSLTFMRAAMNAAEATGGNLGSTTSALAAVMQAYGLHTKDAASASDIMTNVSRLTNTSVSDLATGMDKLHAKLGVAAPSLA